MKVSEMIKKLKKIGCYITEHGTKHDDWYSPMNYPQPTNVGWGFLAELL